MSQCCPKHVTYCFAPSSHGNHMYHVTICPTYNKGMFCQICPKNVTNCFAALSAVYHMHHVPYVPYPTSVGVSNLPQKCDDLLCVFVSCASHVSSTMCIIHNKCMFLKIRPKNVTNCFASSSQVYHMYHLAYVPYITSVCFSKFAPKHVTICSAILCHVDHEHQQTICIICHI